ncbi:NAD-dependent epimerase/dehydratase family protein [Gillisia sp. Hel_I_29]|uniref:NAD-dependent epimerase/dehydratase family protein n=1 Tax=Gillisia sp. Hel_I_29 TaxID=1249975 RepID=UPI00054E6524|nr:NAD-dependent epimerase/dehydratase family protein [Gillisia sp. Hel_I_29]
MNVLVTGAAGFIGSHMSERLHKNGFQVTGVDNFSSYYDVSLKELNAEELRDKGIVLHNIDLRDKTQISELATDFDFIFHFAAQPGISVTSSFEDYLSNNIIATQNLIEFSKRNSNLKHFFNIGTSSIYGLEATFPESVAPNPASHYGVTKLGAEQLVLAESRTKKLNGSSYRLYSVYGPRERPDKLYTKLISCAYNNKSFPLFEGSGEHLRSFTYVGDIIDGLMSALDNHEKLIGEIINIGTEEERSTQEGIDLVEELLDTKIALEIKPQRPSDQWRTLANIDKAKKLLNYNPTTTLKEGLKLQIEWYRSNFL